MVKSIKTSLPGYDKQLFPWNVNQINQFIEEYNNMWGTFGLVNPLFSKASSLVEGYTGDFAKEPVTEDGYKWKEGTLFSTGKGGQSVAVLFPCQKRIYREDEEKELDIPGEPNSRYELDRSVAVYTQGNVDLKDADRIVEDLYIALKALSANSFEIEKSLLKPYSK